jgi:hypothetical protein
VAKKGKTPSLLAISTGVPELHTCGKATECDRCDGTVTKGERCFKIPKFKNGFTGHPIFCVDCTAAIIEQTKFELSAVEQEVLGKGSKHLEQ